MTTPPPANDPDPITARSMEDMELRVRATLPLPIDPELLALVTHNAGITRGEGMALVERLTARDPSAKLAAILAVLKLLVFGRADQNGELLAREKAVIGCGAGCSACCHQNVETTIPEAILVALRISAPDDPRRQTVLDSAHVFEDMSDEARARTGRPCPLLAEGKCSVYDDRPLACRSLFAPDGNQCGAALRALVDTGELIPMGIYPIPQFMSAGDQSAMRGICKDLGLQDDPVDLVQAVAAMLRDPDMIERWAGGQAVFKPLPPLAEAPREA